MERKLQEIEHQKRLIQNRIKSLYQTETERRRRSFKPNKV